MRRRDFIKVVAGSAFVWPLAARAQQLAVARRIAILSDFSELEMQPLIATFREQLQQLGWRDDSIRIDTRLGITGAAQFQGAAAALVGMAPDVIVTLGSPSLRAMKQETRTIPKYLRSLPIRLGKALSRASHILPATPRDSPISSSRSPGNGWMLSKRSRLASQMSW
jgi:putative ABC transport system substrate-binding protein